MFWAPLSPIGSLFQATNSISSAVTGRGLVSNFARDSAGLSVGTAVNRIQGADALSALNDAWANLYNQKRDLIRERVASLGSDGLGSTPRYIYNYSSPRTFDYVNADLAKQYGMNKVTAYNEAMANTAYQRAVADMQQAGLNPAAIFGAGRASTAGSGYASGGSSGGFSSASGAAKGNQLPGWIYYGIQGLAQVVGSLVTKSFAGGAAASQIASTFLKAFNGR